MQFRLALLAGTVLVSGCSRELLFGADSARTVIADLYTVQAVENIGRFIDNRYAIPQEITLGSGQASVSSTLGTGIAPNIALRAIAITGLTLTNTNLYSQNWGLTAVDDFDQIARLQLLYNYALNKLGPIDPATGVRRSPKFADFEKKFSTLPPKIGTLSDTLGGLPDAGFIRYDDSCSSTNPTRTTSHGHIVCFADREYPPINNPKAPRIDPRALTGPPEIVGPPMTAEEVRSQFVLWTIGVGTVAHATPPKPATGAAPAAPSDKRGNRPRVQAAEPNKNDTTMVPPEVRPRQQLQLFQSPNLSIQ